MPQNLTNADEILKEFYTDALHEVFNHETRLMQHIPLAEGANWSGRRVVDAVVTRPNVATMALAESGTLPTASNLTFEQPIITERYVYNRIQLSGPVMRAAKGSGVGSFVNILSTEMKGALRDMKKELNRQFYGDGTGTLATVGTGSSGTTVEVDRHDQGELGQPGTRYLRPGMEIVIGTGAQLAAGSGGVAGSVSSITDSDTFVSNADLSAGDGDLVVKGTSASNHSYNIELTGLLAATDDGTNVASYMNLNRTAGNIPEWQGNLLANSGTARPLSLDLIQRAIDAADEDGGGEIDVAFGHHSARREYAKLVEAERRIMSVDAMKLGFPEDKKRLGKALMYDDIPIHFDADCPFGRLFFLDTSFWKFYMKSDGIEWADDDGSILSRVSNQDNWEAFLRLYGELYCGNPAAQSQVADLQVTL